MIFENLRRIVKATPLLHTLVLPAVNLVRLVREPRSARERSRFRQYCLRLSEVLGEPVFVKIGANDGITSDPRSDILLGHPNWKGALIEPVPYCFDRLRTHFQDSRRFRLEQVAIGTSAGQSTFYCVDAKAKEDVPGLPIWFDQLGSFHRNHIVKHLNGVLEPFIIELQVQVCPLSDVLTRNRIQDVHLLHIDAEGSDFEILKTVNFAQHAPLAIFIEHKHLSRAEKAEMAQFLHAHGYSVHDCGEDYFAVNEQANKRLLRTARARRSLHRAAIVSADLFTRLFSGCL